MGEGEDAYQLVNDGRPSPSLRCSSDWSRQTSLQIVSAWVVGNNIDV